MQLVALQYDIAWEDRAANVATVRRLAAEAAPPPGALLVLPEMAFTGFSMRIDRVADTPAGESQRALAALAREFRCWVLGGRVARAADGRGRNEALLLAPDGALAASYAKMHPYSHGGEDRHYAAGEDPVVVACGDFQLAPFVCYDLRFPEVFRTAAQRGATLLAVIANWLETRHEHWRLLLQARAVENQAWVIGVNRVGRDPKHAYRGGSCIFDPGGRLVASAGETEETIACEAEPELVRRTREEFPVLQDVRAGWVRP